MTPNPSDARAGLVPENDPSGESDVEISIVLPVHNEAPNLAPLDLEIRAVLRELGRPAEIVYVDDRSTDDSHRTLVELADAAAARNDPVPTIVARLRRNQGQTAAMSAGFEIARGRVILPLDADGQNDPADIPRLLHALETENLDVVSGWRKRRRDNALLRTLPSRVANELIGRASGVRLHDYGCTLKAYRAPLLKELRLYGEMHRFIPLYLGMIGARIGELEVNHRPRTAGTSKYGFGRAFRVFMDLFLIRFFTRYATRPMHFFGGVANAFLLGVAATLAFMFALKYGLIQALGIDWRATFIETPLPNLAATFFLGAVLSIFFGILAEILIRIHHESRNSRPYAIETLHRPQPQPRPRPEPQPESEPRPEIPPDAPEPKFPPRGLP